MKPFLFLLGLIPLAYLFQTAVKTETASNKYVYHSALTVGDTIFTKAAAVTGSSVLSANTAVTGELVGLSITEPVSRDTIILKNGAGTIVQIVLDSVYTTARSTAPLFLPFPTRLDTSLIFIQKKGSKSTLFYRITRL